ncbi:MAG: helix-turn-helix domain-containing protein [Clostridia bacterium]|nr:helix-turn-helix domain-containing protein [Clostridia bacterium]
MSINYNNGKYSIDGLATVVLNKVSSGIGPHTHDFIELVYVLRGRSMHTVDNVDYPMSHGDMLLVNYHSTHSYTCEEGLEYVNILIKPEMVCGTLSGTENAFALLEMEDYEEFRSIVNPENCLMHFEGNERKELETLICFLLKEISEDKAGGEFALRSGFNLLLISVFRKMSLTMRTESDGVDEKLLEYIKSNCSQPLTLDFLAGRCGYNPCYFSRLFKRTTGQTLTEYLYVCRIEKACKLLLESDLTVERIIGECGFSNRTKFFGEFTKRMGATPLAYRKKSEFISKKS